MKIKTHTHSYNAYIVSNRHQGQVLLHFIAVEGQPHVVSQFLQIWVQAWENRWDREGGEWVKNKVKKELK